MTNVQVVDNLSAWIMIWAFAPTLLMFLFFIVRLHHLRKQQYEWYVDLKTQIQMASGRCERIENKVNSDRHTLRQIYDRTETTQAALLNLAILLDDTEPEPEDEVITQMVEVTIHNGSDEHHMVVHPADLPELMSFEAKPEAEPAPEEATFLKSKPLDLQSIANSLKKD